MTNALSDFEIDDFADSAKLDTGLEAVELAADFYKFVQAAWSIAEPTQSFLPNWHLEVICEVMQHLAEKKLAHNRLVINVPPGMAKSLVVSVLWPSWIWARNPKARFLLASYGQHLSTRDNLRVRDIITSEWFQARWPLTLSEDQNSKTRYNTNKSGWRIATSVGGMGTGEHPDFIIIDDPTTAMQAKSPAERQNANDWFDKTISSRGYTRTEPVTVVVIMQRLHTDDLSGHLLSRGGVEHLCFPMRYQGYRAPTDTDPGYQPDPRDRRVLDGALLFPALVPEEKVAKLERDLQEDASAQLQQAPVEKIGQLFDRSKFAVIDYIPNDLVRTVRGWDTGGTKDAGDFTVGVKLGERANGRFVILNVVRGQFDSGGVDRIMKATAMADGSRVAQREEREGGASGKAMEAAHLKLLVGFDYKAVAANGGDKVTRSKPFRAQVDGQNVDLVRGTWNQDYIDELCEFPTERKGAHDDQVDATSAAFNTLLLEPRIEQVDCVW